MRNAAALENLDEDPRRRAIFLTGAIFIVVAGVYSLAILGKLGGDLADTLRLAGDAYVLLTMLSTVVMWLILGVGTSLGTWKQRSKQASA